MRAWLQQRKLTLGLLLVVAVTAVVYVPTIRNDFVDYDDQPLIVENAAVQELSTRTLSFIFSTFDPELYVPFTLLTYQIEGQLFGIRPGVVHATNLLLHLLNILLVSWVVFRLTGRAWVTAGVTALFALHPLNAEAVLWASARKDLLSAFFFLASFGSYLVYRRNGRWLTYGASLLLFLCGLFSKVSVAPLPFILLLSDWLERDSLRARWKEKIPFFVLGALFVIIAIVGKTEILGASDLLTNVLLGMKSTAFVLWQLLVPVHFSILYPQQPLREADPWLFVASAAVVIALLGAAALSARRQRVLAFGIGFFLLLLLPSFTNFFRNGSLFFSSDRYAYLPMLGMLVPLFVALDGVLKGRDRLRWVATAGVIGVVLGLAAVARAQVPVWQSTESLFRHVVSLYPRSALAYVNLGVVRTRVGDSEGAFEEFRTASEIDPEYVFPLLNTARLLRDRGEIARAELVFRATVQMVSRKETVINVDLLPFFELAQLLALKGQSREALQVLELAARLGPRIAAAHYYLGVAYSDRGRKDDALRTLELSRSLQPNNADMQYRLAGIYAEQGRLEEAEKALRRVLWLNPSHAKAAEHLQNIRFLLGR
ncbi:MAG TPA: hypothetical protein DEB30_01630 [Candidatus Peribacter riflensis]|uniref:Uncharacterized protein n=1 Tax=Candidatus Peribacter riflensis TaxID=1735162 RepID=A0A0S1SQL2_9BACT|nr:MAG: hypothetical protein PeribacterA2_1053 [Candidatus Peribacter riflensis]OGJ77973.1 MAG: hypothetical protein A2398_01630 [Candidatus Peribacteria bacterium RIFOXYB1_FULL_57_12]ALM11513.1 MAG: hypothetical protein PeribacterB2_1055 [Candidatus Peribacter riflensis]ALM12615.1 MAG: hypothetical protein PeribacterC2_1054 [Candidatus Peribacter riflensis]ALM13716.1 MAG: hypothetical protein PeribacterD1_1053 [Candidatus Peribacter riflensis]